MSKSILPDPPGELKQLSHDLCTRLRAAMQEQGCISFRHYMEMALYEPGLGYYSAGLHKLGETGDFVTAPELGSLFAGCLAQQVEEVSGEVGGYQVLEVGAGTGKLAADLLNSLHESKLPERYNILERSADLQQVQRDRIATEAPELARRVRWLDSPPKAPWQGILLANEVIDALAVERRLDTRQSFDVDKVRSSSPVVNSERVRKLIAAMHFGGTKNLEGRFRRLKDRHPFTPVQKIHTHKLDSYFETHVLEKIYVMEKVGFPTSPAPHSLDEFAKLVYVEAEKRAPELFRSVHAPASYKLVNDLPVKKDRPDEGAAIDKERIASSRNSFNDACYAYLANCGAYPVQANRW